MLAFALWPVFAEAGALMVAASAAIRMIAFRKLSRALYAGRTERPASESEIAVIRRAIHAWSRRLPWRTMCFEEGVTAHWMLRRRGLASTLYYGAATIEGELKAHVWVKSGERDVVGCEVADEYAQLARFPDDQAVSIGSHNL